MKRWERWIMGLVLVVAAGRVCLPFLKGSLPSGHDALLYIPRMIEFHENLRWGNLLPRWAPDLGSGNGQPFFLFTPPLVYYIGEFWRLSGFNVVTALNLVAVVAIVVAACFMFLLGRLFFGPRGGLLGALAYLYSPYFHVNLFVRHDVGESLASAFYPMAIYGFARYARELNGRFLLFGAVSYAAVLLSHNPSAVMFSPVLLAFIAFQSWSYESLQLLLRQSGAVLLAVMGTAFSWFPNLWELRHVHISRAFGGYFSYVNHFVHPEQFLSRVWAYGNSIMGPADTMSFSLGWSHVLLAVVALAALARSRDRPVRELQAFFSVALIVLCFLMMRQSTFLWEFLPLLKDLQFPWRLLAPAGFCLALLVASLARVSATQRPAAILLLWVAAALLLVPNWGHVQPENYWDIDLAGWSAEGIAQGGIEPAFMKEFEPRWVLSPPGFQSERLRVISGNAWFSAVETKPTRWSARAIAQTASLVEARLYYFPGWEARVDGLKVPIEVDRTGRIQFRVTPGNRAISIKFRRTWPRILSELLSLSSAILVVGYAAFRKRNPAGHEPMGLSAP